MSEEEMQIYEYTISILSVRMKIKFACRMRIEHDGIAITNEIMTNQANKFIFNQEVILKEDNDNKYFDLSVLILTDKGAKYNAGLLKISQNQLIHSEGQTMKLPLTKSTDQQATCQIRVDSVSAIRIPRRVTFNKNTKNFEMQNIAHRKQKVVSPKVQGNPGMIGKTKSELHFPLSSTPKLKHQWDSKSRQIGHHSFYLNQNNAMNRKKGSQWGAFLHKHHDYEKQLNNEERDRYIEGEVYKQGYQKLKQKYKKQIEVNKNQHNKRLSLQNNENNYKLQIIRLKLRVEEQEKSLIQRNNKIQQMQNFINVLQQKQLDADFLRENLNNKQHALNMIENTVNSLSQENKDLKESIKTKQMVCDSKNRELNQEILKIKTHFEAKQSELERQIRSKNEQIYQKDIEICSKSELIEKQKKTISSLQKQAQIKIFEFDKQIQTEKISSKQKIDYLRLTVQKLQKQLNILNDQKKEINRENEKYKTTLMKTQYDKKLLQQQNDALKIQISEMKSFKDKYGELLHQHKMTNQERIGLQRQLQKAHQNKEINIEEMNHNFQIQLEYYKKGQKQLDEKYRTLTGRVSERDSEVENQRKKIDKQQRVIQNQNKELIDLKDKDKNLNKILKVKDTEIMKIQSELNNRQNKINSMETGERIQQDKFKQDYQRLRQDQIRNLTKIQQLSNNNTELNMQLSKIKIKLEFSEERIKKDQSNLKQKQNKLENTVKNYENQINSLEKIINNLRSNEKQINGRVQKGEIELIRYNQRIQRNKIDLKNLEQKCQNYQEELKKKQEEIMNWGKSKRNLDNHRQQLENQNNTLKIEINTLQNQKNKNNRTIEILNNTINKLKIEISSNQETIHHYQVSQKQKAEQLKKINEQYVIMEMKFQTYQKDTEKFRQNLIDTLNNTFWMSYNNEIKSNQNLNQHKMLSGASNNMQITNGILNCHKYVRLTISRQMQQNKQINKINEKLTNDLLVNNNKMNSSQHVLQDNIKNLENQIKKIISEKDQQNLKYDRINNDFSMQIQQKNYIIELQNSQCEQLNFTVNSLKLDADATIQQYQKKIQYNSQLINKMQKHLDDKQNSILDLQNKINQLTIESEQLSTKLQHQIRLKEQNQTVITDLQQNKNKLIYSVDQLKKQRKQMMEKLSEVDLYLSTQKQMNNKNQQLLEEEEKKNIELKTFISSLMKQKQQAIRNQLDKSEQIIRLETNLLQLQRDKQIGDEKYQRTKKNTQEQKQQLKILQLNFKQQENQIRDIKIKLNKTLQKLKQKNKEIESKDQLYRNLQIKDEKINEKYLQQIKQYKEQIENITKLNIQKIKNYNQKICSLEKVIQKKEHKINEIQTKNIQAQQNIFASCSEKQKIQNKNLSILRENQGLKGKLFELETNNNNLLQEIKEKQEQCFELSGKLYNFELKLQVKQNQRNQQVQFVHNDWVYKYESLCQEYEQRIELIEKQRDYYKNISKQREEEIEKNQSRIKKVQNEEINIKKMLEEKIKKLQDDRLAIFTNKNQENQRLVQQNKIQFETIKSKQSEHRRIVNQLEVARATISNLDQKSKQYDEKIKRINKVYQTELQQLKKKEIVNKNYKQAVQNDKWNSEREVRKVVQIFIKNFLQIYDDRQCPKLMDLVKGLQLQIMQAMQITAIAANQYF